MQRVRGNDSCQRVRRSVLPGRSGSSSVALIQDPRKPGGSAARRDVDTCRQVAAWVATQTTRAFRRTAGYVGSAGRDLPWRRARTRERDDVPQHRFSLAIVAWGQQQSLRAYGQAYAGSKKRSATERRQCWHASDLRDTARCVKSRRYRGALGQYPDLGMTVAPLRIRSRTGRPYGAGLRQSCLGVAMIFVGRWEQHHSELRVDPRSSRATRRGSINFVDTACRTSNARSPASRRNRRPCICRAP